MLTARRMRLLCSAGTMLCLLFVVHAAAALDTSKPLICAFTIGFDCNSRDGCQSTSPEAAGLPAFIRVDPQNQRVSAAGGQKNEDKRETTIRGVQEADGKIYLYGVERRGWSAVMNKETGHMTMAASSDNEAIVFFGRCMTP